ncbi:MAG: gliding motility lipoprotein GldB [Bacteroidetes bacterium]|nr:gliding motility lipoprotein GldB [Bacteroidota bacterium]
MYRPLLFLAVFLGLASCQSSDTTCTLDEERLEERTTLEIYRLEQEFFAAKSAEELRFLLDKYPEIADRVMELETYPHADSLAQDLLRVNQDSAFQALNAAVSKEFADISDIKVELEQAFAYLKSYYPDFKEPKVYTYVSGFGLDLLVDEDLLVIGLDYFLPSDHAFQPDLPKYIASRYERKYLVPMIVLAISSRYNEIDAQDNTLLAEMVYYGKAYHFVKSILPCTSDQYLIGYTPEQIQACWDNEDLIWTHFIENELLFETNPFEIRKYMGEAPATDAISADAPGRIGRWIGWNIVEEYALQQDLSLPELMRESNAKKLFRDSGYRPRNGKVN